MRRITTSIPSKALIGCIAAATLALAACGGSDDSEPAQPAPTDASSSDSASEPQADADQVGAGDSADTGAADASGGGEIIDQLDEGMGGGLDEALDSLPDGMMWGLVADQLGDDVELEIDGVDVRFTLNEGSSDDASSDGIMDCLIAGAFAEAGETITMIYPDGEVTCGE